MSGPKAVAVATVMLEAGREVEAAARGRSMGDAMPRGATLRIRPLTGASLRRGRVVAVVAGDSTTSHRVVARGPWGPSRRFLITRGDGRTLCDHPVPVGMVLGEVVQWRTGEVWHDIAPMAWRRGWRGPASALFELSMTLALTCHVQLARWLAGAALAAARASRGRPARSGDG